MSQQDPTPSELFAKFLERSGADFEAFCEAHPDEAPEMRDLFGDLEHLREVKGQLGLSGAMTEQVQRHYGTQAGQRVELDDEDSDPGGDSQILERLSGRGDVFGRYRVKGEVGRGGQGAVLRVWDEDLRRSLAMKVLLGQSDSPTAKPRTDPKKLGRFLEEAQVTGQLDHPGIVPVHELGLDSQGGVYFTMKLVKGETLRTVFRKVHDQDPEWGLVRAIAVMLKVCEAVSYAHSKGVVHRDLKSANVMVGRFGEAYVMDWGLARVSGLGEAADIRVRPEDAASMALVRSERRDRAGEPSGSPLVTMEGDVLGTPAFMSPEQARGELDNVGPRSDVYSIGAMLYELLTGQMPYVSPKARLNNHAIWGMVQVGPPTRIERIAKDVPAELVAICEKAMEREPKDRYASVADLRADLQAFLGGRVVQAYRTGAFVEAKMWVQRNRALALASFAAASLLIVGLVAMNAVKASRNAEVERERTVAVAAADKAEWQSYVANLRAAAWSFESEAYAEARRRLDACPEKFRHWEWKHLGLRLDQSIQSWQAHDSAVTALAFDPEGRQLVSASTDSHVLAWNPSDGSRRAPFATAPPASDGSVVPVDSLAYLSGDTRYLTGMGGGTLYLWDELGVVQGRARVDGLGAAHVNMAGTDLLAAVWASGASGKVAGAGGGSSGNFTLVRADGTTVWEHDLEDAVAVIDSSPDGEWVAVGGRRRVYLFDREAGRLLASQEVSSPVSALAFHPDGQRVAMGLEDGTLRLWTFTDGKYRVATAFSEIQLDADSRIECLAFSPDGQRLAAGLGSGRLAVVNTWARELERDLLGHTSPVLSVAFAPDGRHLASGAQDGSVRIWLSAGAASVNEFDVVRDHTIRSVDVSVDGERVVASGGGVVRIWSGSDGTPIDMLDAVASAFDASSDRLFLVDSGGRRRLVDTASGGVIDGVGQGSAAVTLVDLAPGAEHAALALDDGSIELQPIGAPPVLLRAAGTLEYVEELSFSPDGRRLVARNFDTLVAFDVASAEQILERRLPPAAGEFLHLACDPRGDFIAFSTRMRADLSRIQCGALNVIDLRDGEVTTLVGPMAMSAKDALVTPNSIAFSPDGSTLAGGFTDGSLRLWTRGDWTPSIVQGPALAWRTITFSPQGDRIWAWADGSTGVGVFDPQREEWLITMPLARGELEHLAYDALHGRLLVTSDYRVLLSLDGELAEARKLWETGAVREGVDEDMETFLGRFMVTSDAAEVREKDGLDAGRRERLLRRLTWVGDPSADELNSRAWAVVNPDGERSGSVVRALHSAQAAKRLDPSSPGTRETLAWALFFNERYTEAEAEARAALALTAVDDAEARSSYRDTLERIRRMSPR